MTYEQVQESWDQGLKKIAEDMRKASAPCFCNRADNRDYDDHDDRDNDDDKERVL